MSGTPKTWRLGTAPWAEIALTAPRARVIVDNDFSGDPDDFFQLVHHLLSPTVEIPFVVASHLRPGDPMDPSTTLAPLSSQSAVDELTANVRAARDAGVTVEQVGSPVPERGAFFQPTIMTDIPVGSPTASTEFFGPVSSIFRAEDEDDAVRIANSSPFGLGGSVFSNNIHRAQSVARRLDTGMVFINQPTGVAADIPFGGVKRSGYGRELVDLGLKEFVNEKVIAITDIDGQF